MADSKIATISIEESFGKNRQRELLCLALPLASGTTRSLDGIVLSDEHGEKIPLHHASILGHWRDGTASWALLKTMVDIQANENKLWSLTVDAEPESRETQVANSAPLQPTNDGHAIELSLADSRFGIEENFDVSLTLKNDKGTEERLKLTVMERPGDPMACWTRLAGSPIGRPDVVFALDIAANSQSGSIICEVFMHNTAAAEHPNGLWDLGDSAAFELHELTLSFQPKSTPTSWNLTDADHQAPVERTWPIARCLELAQLSSGGDTPRSPVHVDRHGQVNTAEFGYRLAIDEQPFEEGQRITPRVSASVPGGRLEWTVPHFWEEFPSGLRLNEGCLEISMPAAGSGILELQPGESKRRRVNLCLRQHKEPTSYNGVGIAVKVQDGGPLRWQYRWNQSLFSADIDDALHANLVAPEEFLAKRELVDEYGWRNFGDVFADHESLYRTSDESPLISHYNNQYDLILGFGLRYIRDGDERWFQLMDNLARHLADIDIYATANDRVEYNGGLFWHTSHYTDAATSTHRTFSIAAYDPNAPIGSSGGPSSEHCYTNGLALHHYLTGDPASREAVLSLARWIRNTFEGDSCFSGRLFAAFRKLQANRRGGGRGMLPGVVYRYPLNRATAYLLDACLDARPLEPEADWGSYVDYVLESTFSSDDNIDARSLGEIEQNWSYTVFLQAVLKYLVDKETTGELDAPYIRNRAAWCHYLRWMLEHEKPYRDMEESLEFANITWSAQDIRKAALLAAAPKYMPELAEQFRAASKRYAERTSHDLAAAPESSHTRVQALLLQSIGSYYEGSPISDGVAVLAPPPSAFRPEGTFSSIVRSLFRLNIKRELNWWRARVGG